MIKNLHTQKFTKSLSPKNLIIVAPVIISTDVSKHAREEIFKVLETTPFNKISFPLTSYRYYVQENVKESDSRVITVGYIRAYHPDTKEFVVVIYNQHHETIRSFNSNDTKAVIEVSLSEFNGKLNMITNLNILPLQKSELKSYGIDPDFRAPVKSSNEMNPTLGDLLPDEAKKMTDVTEPETTDDEIEVTDSETEA